MTDEQIRIKIAEACGYINPRVTGTGVVFAGAFKTKEGGFFGSVGVPDYPNDLNAMHEAVKTLPTLTLYKGHLKGIVQRDGRRDSDYCEATARQRAEAFLRTLDKWKRDSDD